ncbi:polysaccharide export outer membrane protein [Sphingomonas zeicaulis]|uniref:polysaccharide biosynthesis/export family protein n=1 Tax=Sphingomonas zeicaulis TaxID=1632740 RepID=UPI003D1EF2B2
MLKVGKPADTSGIAFVEIDDVVARRLLSSEKRDLFSTTLGEGVPVGTIVRPGDAVEVTLWEAPPAALFGTSPAGAQSILANTTSQSVSLPEQTVDLTGKINIPFAGMIDASGRTTAQIEAEIIRRLNGKAHQPQALVRIVRNSTATATVVGEVGGSRLVPLSPRGERLLDALASAGGTRQPVGKTTIQITRGAEVHRMSLDRIIADPRQNIILQSGDVVTALFQPYSFTVAGAAGRNEEIPFESSGLTLAQALGRIGGLQDQRADARGMFVFRFEDPAALDPTAAIAARRTPDGRVAVIYRADLRNPATFFAAQSFPMRDKDIIYVSNAPLADLQKFVNIISSIVFPLVTLENATSN